jgi:Leucine-rich repeat (LRR) protein
MTYTKEKIFPWFLLGFQQDSSSQDKHVSLSEKNVYARIKKLSGNAFSLYGANEYDVVINLFQNLKGELSDLVKTLENNIPAMSTLRTDHESRQKYVTQLKDILSEENMFKYSIEHIDTLLNEVNNLLVSMLMLTHKYNMKPSNEEIVSFPHSGLTRITPEMSDIFKQYGDKLKAIDIKNNNLRYFPKDCFNDFQNLFIISLHDNKLTRLPKNTFSGSSNIKLLTLSGNNFGYIHPSNNTVLDKTYNSSTFSFDTANLKRTPLYSLIKNHAAKALSAVTFALAMSITSYLALTTMLVGGFIGLGLALITYKQASKWIREFDQKRSKKGLQPDDINNDAKDIGKSSAKSIASEALAWASPTTYTHYDSYCFGLREQQYASFKNEETQTTSPKTPKI